MALAQIIDLEERRRARSTYATQATQTLGPTTLPVAPMWCYVWVPVYVWYVA